MESLLEIAGRETAESENRSLTSKIALRLKSEFLLPRLSLACSIFLFFRGDSEMTAAKLTAQRPMRKRGM